MRVHMLGRSIFPLEQLAASQCFLFWSSHVFLSTGASGELVARTGVPHITGVLQTEATGVYSRFWRLRRISCCVSWCVLRVVFVVVVSVCCIVLVLLCVVVFLC